MTNARSILPKLDELRLITSCVNADVCIITESWLHEEIDDALLHMNDSVIFRSDRKGRRGGGVCIWVNSYLNPSLVLTSSPVPPYVDISFVQVTCDSLSIICCALYVPPGLCKADHHLLQNFLTQELDSILAAQPNVKLVVAGDFNDFDTLFLSELFCLVNTVSSPTRNSAILDHIWVDEDLCNMYCRPASIGPPLKNSDHNCVLLSPLEAKSFDSRQLTFVWDYRASNIAEFLHRLSAVDFSVTMKASSIEEMCENFYASLSWPLSAIPCVPVIFTANDKPWMTPVLKLLINKRWGAFRHKNWPAYHHFKAKVSKEIAKAKLLWKKKNSSSTRGLWKVANTVRGSRQPDFWPRLASQHGLQGLLDILTTEFSKNFCSDSDSGLHSLVDEAWDLSISPDCVFYHLTKLSSRKAMGPDGIPPKLFNLGAQFLCEPLACIFNTSVSLRSFPAIFKLAHVCPIPKMSSKVDVYNCRPVSLSSPVAKIFERIFLMRMKSALVSCFGRNQHAYRPLGSTTTALVEVSEYVTKALDSRDTVAVNVFCLDLSRAFDKLQHHRLINHLHDCGLNAGFLLWLCSYLKHRTMRVKVLNVLGPVISVQSGVPQGSVLGPFLFGAFMGSIDFSGGNIRCVKYADDVTIVETLQRNHQLSCVHIDHCESISNSKGLLLKKSKCKQLCIRRSKLCPQIPKNGFVEVDSLKILGCIFTSKYKWDESVSTNLKKASRRLHIIRCLKNFLSVNELVTIYHALITSVFLYASPVYGRLPVSLSSRLERFQKRAHRLICGPSCVCPLFPSLRVKMEAAAVKLLLRSEACADHPLHPLVPPRLRASGRLCVPACVTDRRLNAFFPWACLLINSYF